MRSFRFCARKNCLCFVFMVAVRSGPPDKVVVDGYVEMRLRSLSSLLHSSMETPASFFFGARSLDQVCHCSLLYFLLLRLH